MAVQAPDALWIDSSAGFGTEITPVGAVDAGVPVEAAKVGFGCESFAMYKPGGGISFDDDGEGLAGAACDVDSRLHEMIVGGLMRIGAATTSLCRNP